MMETNQGVPVADSDAVAAEEGVPELTREEVNQQIADRIQQLRILAYQNCSEPMARKIGELELLFAKLGSMP